MEKTTGFALAFGVIRAIADDGVFGDFVFVWHGLWGLFPASAADEFGWRMTEEPVDVFFAAMGLVVSKTVLEFFTEGHAELAEPEIMFNTFADPDGAWVVSVSDREIAMLCCGVFAKGSSGWDAAAENPVGCIEKLSGLENHFDHVFVTMPSGTARWFVRKIKDIHFLGCL
jgi:hypothetical protein